MHLNPAPWYRQHWFYLAAFLIVMGDVMVVRASGDSAPVLIEAGVLFDFVILIPALYAFCYRGAGRRVALKALALACLGIWAAGHGVPTEQQMLLEHAGPLRWLGLGVLVVVELKLLLLIGKSAWRGGDLGQAIATEGKKAGMPPWLVRLMSWEARLWSSLWRAVRQFGPRR